jgi:hypothetical protein
MKLPIDQRIFLERLTGQRTTSDGRLTDKPRSLLQSWKSGFPVCLYYLTPINPKHRPIYDLFFDWWLGTQDHNYGTLRAPGAGKILNTTRINLLERRMTALRSHQNLVYPRAPTSKEYWLQQDPDSGEFRSWIEWIDQENDPTS